MCKKHEFQSNEYDLKHHKRILDLSQMYRFSGLPNNAQLEMVEVTKTRQIDSDVTLGIQFEDGSRLTGTFKPFNTLIEILQTLCPDKIAVEENPVIIYMRKEVYGNDLSTTTLKSLGLTGGRAIIRLIHKKPEDLKIQANVSAPLPQRPVESSVGMDSNVRNTTLNLIKAVKQERDEINVKKYESPMEIDTDIEEPSSSTGVIRETSLSPQIEMKKPKIEKMDDSQSTSTEAAIPIDVEPVIIEVDPPHSSFDCFNLNFSLFFLSIDSLVNVTLLYSQWNHVKHQICLIYPIHSLS